jgi:hypothetical protein
MKKLLTIITGLLIAVHSALAGAQDDFAAAYRKAHEAQNVEAFSALVEFSPDTPDWIRNQILESFKSDSKLLITDISFLPLDEKFKSSFEYQGVIYVPTAEPKLKMAVKYDEASQGRAKVTGSTYTIGELNGLLRIISAKPKK